MDSKKKFAKKDVKKSFRKFHDLVNDLFSSKFQTWGDQFTHLLHHCETDEVMRVITEPLKNDPRVNADKWYSDALKSTSSMVGSGRYTLPLNDDEKTSLLYQFFLKIEEENIDITNFCVTVYGESNYQMIVDVFNRELVEKFSREVLYRLEDILSDSEGQKEISREAMIVFHHHDSSTNITGDIHGSNIATSGSEIKSSPIKYNSESEIIDELRSLTDEINSFSKRNQETLKESIDILISATEGDKNKKDVKEAVKTISEISPTISSRIKKIAEGAGSSMIGSVIIEGIKLSFGI